MEQQEEFYEVEPKKEVSVTDLTRLVCQYVDSRAEYDEAKTLSSAKHDVVEGHKTKIIEMLNEAGLKKFSVPGVGDIMKIETLTYQTPKDPADKEKLFGYIENKFGKDGFLAYASINHQTLNSLAKLLVEGGETAIPGLGLPKSEPTLRFNRSK